MSTNKMKEQKKRYSRKGNKKEMEGVDGVLTHEKKKRIKNENAGK